MGTRPQIGSVVAARLEKIDAFFPQEVHEPVFLGHLSRPRPGRQVLQRLGFSDAGEWIAQDSLNHPERPDSRLAVHFHPVPEVFDELGLKDAPHEAVSSTPTSRRSCSMLFVLPPPLRARTTAADQHGLSVLGHTIEQTREVGPRLGVCHFQHRRSLLLVQVVQA